MRKIIITVALFLVSYVGFAQNGPISDVKVGMSFNKSLFPMVEGNMYRSTEPAAGIMAEIFSGSYEEAKKTLSQFVAELKDLTEVKKGELNEKGKSILYQTFMFKNEQGLDLVGEYYMKIFDDQNIIIMVCGSYDVKAKTTFKDEIKKAAVSAKLVSALDLKKEAIEIILKDMVGLEYDSPLVGDMGYKRIADAVIDSKDMFSFKDKAGKDLFWFNIKDTTIEYKSDALSIWYGYYHRKVKGDKSKANKIVAAFNQLKNMN